MAKPIFIFRIGTRKILNLDKEIAQNLVNENAELSVSFVSNGLIGIYLTEVSIPNIKDMVRELSFKHANENPIVVWEAGKGEINLLFEDDLVFTQLIRVFESNNDISILDLTDKQEEELELSMDQLLDKISVSGLDGLSEYEAVRLKNLTNKK